VGHLEVSGMSFGIFLERSGRCTGVQACISCKFTNGDFDPSNDHLAPYAKWVQELADQQKRPDVDESFDAESIQIQSAVCEKLPDAVTGARPPL
jgi:hypothetical protein